MSRHWRHSRSSPPWFPSKNHWRRLRLSSIRFLSIHARVPSRVSSSQSSEALWHFSQDDERRREVEEGARQSTDTRAFDVRFEQAWCTRLFVVHVVPTKKKRIEMGGTRLTSTWKVSRTEQQAPQKYGDHEIVAQCGTAYCTDFSPRRSASC